MLASNAIAEREGRRRCLLQSGALGAGVSLLGSLGCKTHGPRIDSHQHFWTYGADNYPWIDPASPVARAFMPAELAPQLEAAGIDGTIAVEARSQLDETEDLLEFARQARFVRGVVGWLPLADPGVGGLIERYAENPKLRGVRHAILAEADPEFMFREDFNRGIALLHRFGRGSGLRFDLLLAPTNLGRASRFVDRHPHQIFILDHFAKPFIARGLMELRELARRPNVFAKVSGPRQRGRARQLAAERLATIPRRATVGDAGDEEREHRAQDAPGGERRSATRARERKAELAVRAGTCARRRWRQSVGANVALPIVIRL